MAQRFKAKTLLSNSGRFNDEVIAPNLVYNTGNQTISGTKTFDVAPILGGNQLITGNLSLYATTVNLISTGSRIDTLSGNLITTGSRIDSLSGEVVFNTGNQTIDGLKTFSSGIISSVGISGSNLVYNTGNQTISGIKTFATGIITSGNLQVSGTGIFNAIDLNNIDNLSLSGVDITITSGVVSLTNAISAPNIVYNTGDQNISGDKIFKNKIQIGDSQTAIYTDSDNTLIVSGYQSSLRTLKLIAASPSYETYITFGPGSDGLTFKSPDYFFLDKRPEVRTSSPSFSRPVALLDEVVLNTGNQIISGIKTFVTGIVAPNIVYNTGDQTVNGLKAFSQGISVTGGIINLIGKHSTGTGYQTGESIILRGGSGVSNGDAITSRAKGGDIILIPGNAVSGGLLGNVQGNILLSGTSGAFPLSYVGMADDGGSARINIVGGATNDDPRGGNIVIEGNLHINPSNSIGTRRGTRNFTIYKSGSVIAGDVNFRVTENSVTVNNPIYANNLVYNTGNQTISGVKTFATGVVIPNIVYNTGTQTISGIKTFSTGLVAPNIVYNTGTQNINGVKTFANPVFISNISGVSGSGISIITNFASSAGDEGDDITISSASGSVIGGNLNLYAGNSANIPGNLQLYAGRNNATSKGKIYLDGDIQVNPFFGAAGSNQHNGSITIYKTGTFGSASDILIIDQSKAIMELKNGLIVSGLISGNTLTGVFNTLQITNKKLSSYSLNSTNFIFGDNYLNFANSSSNLTGILPSGIVSGINYYAKNLNSGIFFISGSGSRTIDGFSTLNLYKNESVQLVGVNTVGYTGWVTISADGGIS